MWKQAPQAAVLVLYAYFESGPKLLLTQRARNLSMHAGEVAFPGGKRDPSDDSLWETALRETEEEVGIDRTEVNMEAELPKVYSGTGIRVSPFVGRVKAGLPLVLNASEIATASWIPVADVIADKRIRTDVFSRFEQEFWAPAYRLNGYYVWGLTSRIMVDFVNRGWQAGIGREHSAPVACFKP